jgi:hypothetical protein
MFGFDAFASIFSYDAFASTFNYACASCKIIAAPFSAIIIVGALVLPDVMRGIADASATRKP